MKARRKFGRIRLSEGFTLIEVLVAVVVLAIGLLGLAGLQISSLRGNQSAHSRTQASLIVDDMVERIRANRDSAVTYVDGTITYPLNCGATALPNPYCGDRNGIPAAACTAVQIAAYDGFVWQCGEDRGDGTTVGSINTVLPQGGGSVVRPVVGGPFTVTVNWTEVNPDRSPGALATVAQNVTAIITP